jgi:hypothetical protein
VLEHLFGNDLIEKVFFYLLSNETCYASQLKTIFGISLYSIQRILGRLERGGIVVSYRKGKTLIYQFNPRYPFLSELKMFLEKAYSSLPEEMREKYYEPLVRKRPRRRGKPIG